MAGATACIPRNTPVWFTARTRSQTSSGVSVIVRPVEDAGVVHQHVDAARVGEHAVDDLAHCAGSVTSWSRNVPPRSAAVLRALVDEHIGEVHRGAFGREERAFARALSARPTGDDGDLAVELPICASSAYRPPRHPCPAR